MGTINYKTGDFITMAIEPVDRQELIDEMRSDPEEFNIDPDDMADDQELNEIVNEYVNDFYAECYQAASDIVDNFTFEYFKVRIEYGYYEGVEVLVDKDFYYHMEEEDRKPAIDEAKEVKKMLFDLADDANFVSCIPGWGSSYEDGPGTKKAIDEAYDAMVKAINESIEPEMKESMDLYEAASNYNAKLNQFLDGQPKEVQQFVKKALNQIFMGIKADFDGYVEGKRPTIKNFGNYQLFKMVIQANSDVKKGSNDEKGKWNFHYPVKDYCKGLGKIINKKIDGDTYECVLYNHNTDLENLPYGKNFDDETAQSVYPMVGCYSTGIGGNYKNLTKDVPGTTYSIIVSIPNENGETFENPFMTKSGTRYTFSNDHHSDEDGKDTFTVTYDMSDGEFTVREFRSDSADRYTAIYKGRRNSFKAFKELCDTFNANTSVAQAQGILTKNGLRCDHSWWFNPYTD